MLSFNSDQSFDPGKTASIELGVGVFYFPSTSLSPEDQISVIDLTLTRLNVIIGSIEEDDFKGFDCYRVADLHAWLNRFRNLLTREAEKISKLIAIPDPAQENPATTLNGHTE